PPALAQPPGRAAFRAPGHLRLVCRGRREDGLQERRLRPPGALLVPRRPAGARQEDQLIGLPARRVLGPAGLAGRLVWRVAPALRLARAPCLPFCRRVAVGGCNLPWLGAVGLAGFTRPTSTRAPCLPFCRRVAVGGCNPPWLGAAGLAGFTR